MKKRFNLKKERQLNKITDINLISIKSYFVFAILFKHRQLFYFHFEFLQNHSSVYLK